MSTFIYSPGVKVLIDTLGHGIIDVTEDLIEGDLRLAENQISKLNIGLLNHRRKYDGIFTPNDVVHVQMKRVTWLPVFSGLLNEVPYSSVYPREIKLSASDTLKRLQMKLWDSGTLQAMSILQPDQLAKHQVDGGMRDRVIRVLTQVAGWPQDKIHIGKIPNDWVKKIEPLQKTIAELPINANILGQSGVVQGDNLLSKGEFSLPGNGVGTGVLPMISGKAGVYTKATTFELTAPERGGPGGIGSANGPKDAYFIAMRWPYKEQSGAKYLSATDENRARNWWKNRKILVVNPNTNQGVVLRAVDWGPSQAELGPNDQGQVARISPMAMNQLSADSNTSLEFRFAGSDAPIGQVTGSQVWTSPTGPGVSASNRHATRTQTDDVMQANVVRDNPAMNPSLGDNRPWVKDRGLQPHVAAAVRFAKANWDLSKMPQGISQQAVVRNIASTDKPSDHSTGHATDIYIAASQTIAQGQQLALGNAIAKWFVANPRVFGSKYVIWQGRINQGKGWTIYHHPEVKQKGGCNTLPHSASCRGSMSQGRWNLLQHFDHVHVSFVASNPTQAGPQGFSWPGSSDGDFNNFVSTSNNGATWETGGQSIYSGINGVSGPLLNTSNWLPTFSLESELLAGPRALMNDKPVMDSISELMRVSQRSFMAAPNGDFIGWFPDYFGVYGTAARMLVKDIELANEGFTIQWNDEKLITHQYVSGSFTGFSMETRPGEMVQFTNRLLTAGIATIEMPELMDSLFNMKSSDPRAKYLRDAKSIYERFGARVNSQEITTITGPEAEFWFAVSLFQRNWASQFSSQVFLTFMPEVWPGMLLLLEGHDLQVYVEAVTHRFNFARGGFTTEVTVIAPSTSKGSGFYGVPIAGNIPERPVLVGGEGGGGGGGNLFTT